jgi:integrase
LFLAKITPLPDTPLAEARVAATEARKLRAQGKDPIAAREAARVSERLLAAHSITFAGAAAQYMAAHTDEWNNAKTRYQWRATLRDFAFPVFGNVPVAEVDTALVVKALQPIWTAKAETASKLRGRIEKILDWATTMSLRQGDNPARWKGHLSNLLAKTSKAKRVRHLAALPFDQVAAFMADVAKQGGVAAEALQFTIFTCARTSEAIGAEWGEIDFDAKEWVVPGSRMKMGKEHRVPLAAPVLSILRARHAATSATGLVFPGGKKGKPLSNMAMLKLLKRMDRDDVTVHGFRSSFRDWAAERTNFAREVCEQALAHTLSDKVEAAYRRGDLFEKRRKLMDAWAAFCTSPVSRRGEVVVPIGAAKVAK